MKRILVLDHSPADAARCAGLVESLGCEAVVCQTTGEAMKALGRESLETWGAALLLWETPGLPTVAELLAYLRQAPQQLPVIVMMNLIDARVAARLHALGAAAFLLKPLDAVMTRETLQRALAPQLPEAPLVGRMRARVIGESPALLRALHDLARTIPEKEATVLLLGECGCGKELLARAVHDLGPRAEKPWIAVNVTAIPAKLAESQLFGHEKGAFTGAVETHIGYLEQAGEGTLFLDEIGDLAPDLQPTLLRALQERTFRRIGGKRDLDFKARVVAATNQELALRTQEQKFRLDLYSRLAQYVVHIPALRDRHGDIGRLAEFFLARPQAGKPARLARETNAILQSYRFPGNVRELENMLAAALVKADGEWILPHHLPLSEMGTFDPGAEIVDDERARWPQHWLAEKHAEAQRLVMEAFDREYLLLKYRQAGSVGVRAAALAGVDRKTFNKRWNACGLPPQKDAQADE